MNQRYVRAAMMVLLVATLQGSAPDTPLPSVQGGGLSTAFAQLPLEAGSVRFAVIGDSGTGGSAQREVAHQMELAKARFPFEFVLMLGDNLYGRERPKDYVAKFERPYASLLSAGVTFHAVLGNHDEPEQRFYGPFNMGGQRYYSFRRGPVEFFAIDSTGRTLSTEQVAWLEQALAASDAAWKIAYMHHPLYSSGRRHGPSERLREVLEPLFVKYGVDAVFAGHEHFYERLQPQKDVYYFISGAAGKLRRGNVRRGRDTLAAFDTGYSFMVVEIAGNRLYFQSISDEGAVVDAGALPRPPEPLATTLRGLLTKSPALSKQP